MGMLATGFKAVRSGASSVGKSAMTTRVQVHTSGGKPRAVLSGVSPKGVAQLHSVNLQKGGLLQRPASMPWRTNPKTSGGLNVRGSVTNVNATHAAIGGGGLAAAAGIHHANRGSRSINKHPQVRGY